MNETARVHDIRLRDVLLPEDEARIRDLVAATGFFTPEEVAIAVELVLERLVRGPASGYEFLLAESRGELVGYTCYGRICGTRSSWELYWIAVDPDLQGFGVGHRLLRETEARARAGGGTRLYAETSGRGLYRPTRGFYRRNGFSEAAVLDDFYAPGDDKVIFRKTIA